MICGKLYLRIFLANSCCVLNVCIIVVFTREMIVYVCILVDRPIL